MEKTLFEEGSVASISSCDIFQQKVTIEERKVKEPKDLWQVKWREGCLLRSLDWRAVEEHERIEYEEKGDERMAYLLFKKFNKQIGRTSEDV